jgi:DNA-binding SARP family transcriptional activator
MIELTLLGKVEVRGAGGPDGGALPRSPKRLALLAYLAVEGVGTYQRRDTLVALLWPEMDQGRARSALRSLLRLLRRDLGEGVLVNRGQEEVGLDPERITCDAGRFESALEAGERRAALEAFGGDLLPGFFLDGAADFERWLEDARASLRSRAVEAAWALAAEAEVRGNALEAARLARRAVALSPFDEVASVRLMELLARLRDRTGALAEYRRLERHLAEEFGLEPSPETVALAEGLEAGVGVLAGAVVSTGVGVPVSAVPGGAPDAGTGSSVTSEVEAPATAPPRVGPPSGPPAASSPDLPPAAPPRGRRRTRWTPAGLAAIALAGLLALPWIRGRLGSEGGAAVPPPDLDARAVAILPFMVDGGAQHAYLGEGIVDLLAVMLDVPGEVRAVDPRTSIALAAGPADPVPARGRRVAQRAGASSFITGRIDAVNDELRIVAEWSDLGGLPMADAVVEAPAGALGAAVDLLARRLLEARYDEPGTVVRRAAASTSGSLPALRAFLDGEREYRAARYGRASEAFRRALDLDPTFALAHLRRAQAQEWVDDVPAIQASLDSAWVHRDRLPHRVRFLVDARRAYWIQDYTGALSAYGDLLARYPEDVEGLYGKGDLIFHDGPSLGIPMTVSRREFERILRLDPGHREARLHLARVALAERRWSEAAALADPLATGPNIQHAEARAILMIVRGVTPAGLDSLEAMTGMEGLNRGTIVLRTVEFAQGREGSLPLIGLALEMPSPTNRAAVRLLETQVLLNRGDSVGAARALGDAIREDPRLGWSARAALAFAGPPDGEPVHPDTIRAIEAAAPPDSVLPGEGELATAERLRRMTHQTFLLGLLAAEAGDAARAGGLADELPAGEGGYATMVRAWVAHRAGDTRGAATVVREARYLERSLGLLAYLRGEIHRAAGEDDEAPRWYASAMQDLALGLVYHAVGQRRIAAMGGGG